MGISLQVIRSYLKPAGKNHSTESAKFVNLPDYKYDGIAKSTVPITPAKVGVHNHIK